MSERLTDEQYANLRERVRQNHEYDEFGVYEVERLLAEVDALRAERDAANALGAETTAQLKTARYHLDVMLKEGEAAEAERDDLRARIEAAMRTLTVSSHPHCRRAYDLLSASPQPPNPKPSPCATCGGQRTVEVDTGARVPALLRCPSCSASTVGEAP